MGRGDSYGGGASSLGYLFGSGEAPNNSQTANKEIQKPSGKAAAASQTINKDIPAGVAGDLKNNYHRADGQNCGNFLTGRPTTKVQAAPGGGSSLDYLFSNGGK